MSPGPRRPLPFTPTQLQKSCFYPCAGTDPRPVVLLWKEVRTYVYADYSCRVRESFADLLLGFQEEGFSVSTFGDLSAREALGLETWPERFHREHRPEAQSGFWDLETPWAELIRLEDQKGRSGNVLYLGTEALAAYWTVYAERGSSPRWLALLRPGCALGGGWTDFWCDAPFLNLLEENSGGMPRHLLCDDYCPHPLRPRSRRGEYAPLAELPDGLRPVPRIQAYAWWEP